MLFRYAPLALPALCLVGAVATGRWCSASTSVPLAGALVAAGIAHGRRSGACVAAAGLGLLSAWGQPHLSRDPPAVVDTARPLLVSGHLAEEWQRSEYGWQTLISVDYVYQHRQLAPWTRTVPIRVQSRQQPPSGGRLRGVGFLRRAPGLANDPPTTPGRWSLTIKSTRLLDIEYERSPPRCFVALLRGRLSTALAQMADGPGANVLPVLLLGRSDRLARHHRQTLRRLGLAHLFAVSGLHIALVAAGAYLLSAPLPRPLRLAVALTAIALYAVVTGARPSILRAGLMAVLAAVSLGLGRPTVSLQSLSAAVVAMVLASPTLVFEVGFQLTAAATAGIVCLTPLLTERWSGLPTLLRRSLAASVGAQIGCGPWVWSRFAIVTPAAPIFNLLAVPWMALLLAVSLVWGCLAVIEPAAAAMLTPLIDLLAAPLALLAKVPPAPVLTWPVSLTPLEAGMAALCLLGALLLRSAGLPRLLCLLSALLLFSGPLSRPRAELTMLDVGQGDSLLLRDGRHTALIDGGGWRYADIAARVLLPVLAAEGVRSLDSVVVTHSDIDHCQGLADLARYLPVNEVVVATTEDGGPCLDSLSELPWIRFRRTTVGDSWSVGRWRLRTVHPGTATRQRGNNGSLVIQASVLGRRILLTGDIEEAAEREILRREPRSSLASDILKVAHHGSGTSTSHSFLGAVSPQLGLISVGQRNRYGHPAPNVIDRLRGSGVSILRTDRDGMIRLIFREDGTTRIETFGPLAGIGLD